MGKCPKCEKLINSVNIEPMDIKRNFQAVFVGVGYSCPWCHSILSVGIDPVALKTDTVNEVIEALKGR